MTYANNKGADQPAHPRSLSSAFVVRCLDNIIPIVSISKISSLGLASMAAQVSLSLPWSQTPKTGFFVTRLKGKQAPRTTSRIKQHRRKAKTTSLSDYMASWISKTQLTKLEEKQKGGEQ